MTPFRIAYIGVDHPHGAGWRELLPLFGSDVALTALVPGYRGGTASLEERYAHLPRYQSVGELLAHEAFEGAMVSLPNAESPAVVAELARAGKAILLEKPGAASLADFTPAAQAIRQNRVPFTTGYLWRYDPIAERIRTMIADGRFGRLISIEASLVTSDVSRRGASHYLFDPAASGRGFFNWLGCHMLDLLPFLTQDTIVAVTARVGSFGTVSTAPLEDGGSIILELAQGTLVTLTGGYWLPRWAGEHRWAFRGSQRWVHWDAQRPGTGGVLEIHGPQPQFHAMEETFTQPVDSTPGYGASRGRRLIQDWLEEARNGTPPGRNSLASALTVLKLLDLVYQSSEEGRRLECRVEPHTDLE